MDPLVRENELLVVLSTTIPSLVALFFIFRVLPWAAPGAWRIVWSLAALASLMFIIAEGAILSQPELPAISPEHQLPLFAGLLAAAGGFFIVYMDAYRAAQREHVLALTDPLTGLANVRAFEERLRLAVQGSGEFCLVYIDVDGFKRVNDVLGHEAGNALLQDVSAVLRRSMRQSDMAARVGGDEFALLLFGAGVENARAIAERALAGIREVSARLPQGLHVAASVGIATRADGRSSGELIAVADGAMYRAKRAGGDRLAFAAPEERSE